MQKQSPLLIHVPHAGIDIPAHERVAFPLSEPELAREKFLMTDHYCDMLFDFGETELVFPYSRLLCDMERFRRDEDEPMAARGMGAVYTKRSDGRILRRVTANERERILREYYDAHHARFASLTWEKLEAFGCCLILDGHSFHPSRLPHEDDPNRPDICIGVDEYHTPLELVERCVRLLTGQGCTVAINSPFSGSIVPIEFYRKDANVLSIMFEVNRRLYMDGRGEKTPEFDLTRMHLRLLWETCRNYISEWNPKPHT